MSRRLVDLVALVHADDQHERMVNVSCFHPSKTLPDAWMNGHRVLFRRPMKGTRGVIAVEASDGIWMVAVPESRSSTPFVVAFSAHTNYFALSRPCPVHTSRGCRIGR